MNDIPILQTVDRPPPRKTRWKPYAIGGLGGSLIIAALIVIVVQSGVLNPKSNDLVSPAEGTPAAQAPVNSAAETPPSSEDTSEVQGVTAPSAADAGTGAMPVQGDNSHEGIAATAVETQAPLPTAEAGTATKAQDSGLPNPETGDLTISGRISNQAGDPVPKIEVTARLSGYSQSASNTSAERSRSDEKGVYEISDLFAGEYRIETTPTDIYPSAVIVARAGLQSADIVLIEGHEVEVFGTVTNTAGTPLAGVEVFANYQAERARTDDEGRYAYALTTQSNRGYTLHYQLEGFKEGRVVIQGAELAQSDRKRIDMKLAPEGNATNVTGLVRSEYGDNVAGASIQLTSNSLKTRYHGASDRQGEFLIPDVAVGSDYVLTVTAGEFYERYSINPVAITPDHPSMEIALTALGAGRVSGNIMDVIGNPISNFSLSLRNSRASHKHWPVVSDDVGYFEVERVPEGELTFTTQSNPYLQTRGASLQAGEQLYVNLVLDWGNENIVGQVVNGKGQPVAGATVSLRWAHQRDGLQSSSSRRTIADGAGAFRFTQLGPGIHTLDVSSAGYERTQQDYDVGREFGELAIELKSK